MRLLALNALTAIGAAILFLALPGSHRASAPRAATSDAHSYATPASVAAQAPAGFWRDPQTHALVRVHIKRCDMTQLRIEPFCALP